MCFHFGIFNKNFVLTNASLYLNSETFCSSGLNLDNLMPLLTSALSHTSGDVREKAEKVIVSLYGKCGSIVKNYLPTDDEKTRKILTYKQLFKEFDKIDSSLTPDDIRVCHLLDY